jgi:hypothetical protein
VIDRITALHAKVLQTKDDEETLEDMLRELATITICGHQLRSAGTVDAAVEQWKAELQTAADETGCGDTEPPGNSNAQPTTDDARSSQLIFTPYETTDIDARLTREFDKLIDRRISQKFNARDWKDDERDHLYVFECEKAEGMCKLGRTKNLSRRASQHDKCYPLLTRRLSVYCPNAGVFETVVQLEFAQRRYQHDCHACNKTHIEWFKADLDEIAKRLDVWSQLSCHLQIREKRLQLTLPLAGASSDPDRWYNWAQGWVRTWNECDARTTPSTPGGSSANFTIMTDDEVQSLPGLSPSSSPPGTPDDDYNDPPTPTPVERSWNGKSPLRPRLAIRTASQSMLDEIYYTPVETMPTAKGPVLFPVIPGAFPVSPVKGLPEGGEGNDSGLDNILESIRTLWLF